MVAELFGRRLREMRKAKGLSAAALGRLLGVEGLQVYRWEKGESWLKPENLDKLVEVFEAPPSQFFDEVACASSGASHLSPVPTAESGRDNHGKDEVAKRRRKNLKAQPAVRPGLTHVGGQAPGIMCQTRQPTAA